MSVKPLPYAGLKTCLTSPVPIKSIWECFLPQNNRKILVYKNGINCRENDCKCKDICPVASTKVYVGPCRNGVPPHDSIKMRRNLKKGLVFQMGLCYNISCKFCGGIAQLVRAHASHA